MLTEGTITVGNYMLSCMGSVGDKHVEGVILNKKTIRIDRKQSGTVGTQFGSSIKFQLSNPNVKQIETLTQDKPGRAVTVNLGPLALYLGHDYAKMGRKKPGRRREQSCER